MAIGPTRALIFAFIAAAGGALSQEGRSQEVRPQEARSQLAALAQHSNAPLDSLEEVTSRTGPDFAAAYEGREVSVHGQVASPPLWAVGMYYLPLRDATDHGLILRGERDQFANFEPGDWIEAHGKIESRAGLPLLVPEAMAKVGHDASPTHKQYTLAEIANLRYLGLLVETRGTVTRISDNIGGKILEITDRGFNIGVFLPRTGSAVDNDFPHIHAGDRVLVTGLATQYAPLAPFNQGFQIMLASPSGIGAINSSWILPPLLIASALGVIGLLLGMWWLRERRMTAQRSSMRTFHALCEDIISAPSPREIAAKLMSVLPMITQATGTWLYLFNRRTNSLERVPTDADPEPVALPIEASSEDLVSGVVVCFRNRTQLNIPDVRRSPFVHTRTKMNAPRSVMLVPLSAQNDILGVIEIGNANRLGYFTLEEQAAVQHLANQVATALKLQEQRAMREQLFRSEKLAATGQLISGVASELRAPLESILQLARSLAAYHGRPAPERDLKLLAGESQRASEIVSRLVSFARLDDSESRVIDMNALLADLMRFREPEWKTLGLRAQNRLAAEPAFLLCSHGQIEQVFLNLLVHAEQCAAASSSKTISVATSVIAGRVLVEVGYSTQGTEAPDVDPFAEGRASENGALGLGVCRGIIRNHGGEIRFQSKSGLSRFEVDLPKAGAAEEPVVAPGAQTPSRPLTLMLVDSDPGSQRQLLGLLSLRGHRVVPAVAAEAIDLAQRLRFDAVFWAMRLLPDASAAKGDVPGQLRTSISAFVLLTEGYDAELVRSVEESGGFLLRRPVSESDLDRILRKIESRAASAVRR